jgi:hydrogenase accessory protein HypB
MHKIKISVVEGVLDANDTIAAVNRADLDRAGVVAVNLMSAPGAGKTAILERTVSALPGVRVGVLEGDVQGSADADRLAALHVPVTQLNTDPGFGAECHLDANMVRSALPTLPLDELDLLIVENVGNLVCPAEFRIGEHARVMVSAITEGEDKPQVPADVPRLRARADQQDRPARAPRLRPRPVPLPPRRRPSRRRADARQRPHRRRSRRLARLAGRARDAYGGAGVSTTIEEQLVKYIADVARANKADEQAMAAKLASLWDLAVDLSLKEEGVEGAPPIPPPGSRTT